MTEEITVMVLFAYQALGPVFVSIAAVLTGLLAIWIAVTALNDLLG